MIRECWRRRLAPPCLAILVGALVACTTSFTLEPVERQPEGFAPWDETVGDYRLLPNDEIEIRFFYTPELNDRLVLGPDGTVHLQFVGRVMAAGRTLAELQRNLTRAYAKDLIDPQLVVVLRGIESQQVYVGGQVIQPGIYPMVHQLDVLRAILLAGGFRETARVEEIVLIRRNRDNRPMLRTVNVKAFIEDGGPTEDETDRTTRVGPDAADRPGRDRWGDGVHRVDHDDRRVATDDHQPDEPKDIGDVPLVAGDIVFVPRSHIAEVNTFVDQFITRVLPFNRNFNYNIDHGDVFGSAAATP